MPLFNVGTAAEDATRRTDQATGNNGMYFDVDEAYAYANNYRATITVTYYMTRARIAGSCAMMGWRATTCWAAR